MLIAASDRRPRPDCARHGIFIVNIFIGHALTAHVLRVALRIPRAVHYDFGWTNPGAKPTIAPQLAGPANRNAARAGGSRQILEIHDQISHNQKIMNNWIFMSSACTIFAHHLAVVRKPVGSHEVARLQHTNTACGKGTRRVDEQ